VLTLRLGVPLAILLLGSFICHADLARDRPDPEHVTAYYLWIAIGGFAGGVFGNLVAPLLFNSVAEYPLSMAMVALMFSMGDDQGVALAASLRKPITWLRIGVTVFPFVVWVVVNHKAQVIPEWWDTVLLVLLLASMALWRLPGQFAVATLCVALMSSFGLLYGKATKHMRRSFFGVVRITEVSGRRSLVHGTTLHGAQRIDPFEEEPRAYYQAMSPLSRSATLQKADAHIAVIGLGCGSLAYYGKAGQTMRFYEIDPIIEPLARHWFTFLNHSKAAVDVKLGDARLTLRDAPEHSIDMLLVDAFSSDAIPIHLITVEAMQLYLTKLKPDGFIIMHISNRHLDLVPVVRALAKKLKLSVAHIDYSPDAKIQNGSKVEAVALATSKEPLQKLLERGWEDLDEGDEVLWTDDRSNLLSVISE
jgi:spermidine synthase